MKDLKDLSDDDLEKELARRKKAANAPPKELLEKDWERVMSMVRNGLKEAIDEERMPEDFDQYVYEAVIDTMYGRGFWAWRNRQDW